GVLRYQQNRYGEALRLIAAALKTDSKSVAALSNYGLVLDKLGSRADAVATYDKALALAPDNAALHYNRGIVLHALGRDAEAVQSYDKALAIRPNDADTLSDRGNALRVLGRRDEALASFDEALDLMPGHINALYSRATLLHEFGRFAEALKCCNIFLVLKPDHTEALNVKGKSLVALGRADEALASYDKALAIDPQHVNVLLSRCKTLGSLGRNEEALETCDRALAIAPDDVSALNMRGGLLQLLRRHDDALACYDRVLTIDGGHIDALCDRGAALVQVGRYSDALASLEKALAINPVHTTALNNRGTAFQRLGRPVEALSDFDRVLKLAPRHAGALTNKGGALMNLGRFDEALRSFIDATAADPKHLEAYGYEALARLCLGDFREGWKKYETRWSSFHLEAHRRDVQQPLWLGKEPLEDKTILLYAEQGLGDTIQFSRYVSLVAKQGAKVLLEVQSPLTALLSGFGDVARVVVRGEPLPPFDLHCPLMSLPLAFGTELISIPPIAELHVPPDRLTTWQTRLSNLTQPKVGLVWAGRSAHGNDHNRSIPLARLSPALSAPGIQFVSLQHELREGDAALLASYPSVLRLGEEFGDFADTAAVISLLDVVVTIDTSVAHLAAALGKPTWILLPLGPDFRWLLGREDSPWYPSARLFRQQRFGDWDSVIQRVSVEIGALAAQTSRP
ncbi:MAG: hypothetical protein QOJ96_2013, partial [Alphaproteobacteria bacterium]|nr:hypothetical protein [Alphaproteobacteria bacterium]